MINVVRTDLCAHAVGHETLCLRAEHTIVFSQQIPVKAGLRVAQRVDPDYAGHLPSVFRRKPGGVDADRLHIIRF
ncbi:MAG: hypothetical protein WAJ99_01110, partial [Candidatus Sulfotelmatobacter sp.]